MPRAIEDAGIRPSELKGNRKGVFVGAMTNDWAMQLGLTLPC
ncbi:MAG: hypothetical protein H7240_02510 [Glaciimonas sp.]|nr:hypothetical protein [Glaciimonas sp.]